MLPSKLQGLGVIVAISTESIHRYVPAQEVTGDRLSKSGSVSMVDAARDSLLVSSVDNRSTEIYR